MFEELRLALKKDWNVREMNDAAVFLMMIAKNNNLKVDGDFIWITVKND